MLRTALLVTIAALAPGPQDGTGDEPDLRRVFALAERMRDALEGGTPAQQLVLLEEGAELPHAEIASVVEQYARARDRGVRLQALETLRWMEIPEALEALHDLHGRRAYAKDDEWHEALVKGIGQHADPTSIALLREPPRTFRNEKAVRAQLFALARIRHRRSVEGLIELLPRFGRHRDEFLGEFHLALVVLTGMDKGLDPAHWVKWWEAERLSFRVPERMSLPPAQMKRWLRYWDLPDPEQEKG